MSVALLLLVAGVYMVVISVAAMLLTNWLAGRLSAFLASSDEFERSRLCGHHGVSVSRLATLKALGAFDVAADRETREGVGREGVGREGVGREGVGRDGEDREND